MTRINAGVPVAELTGPHLLAEHREIKRVPNVIKKGKYSMAGQPTEFKMGTGHVKFFYDKLLYLEKRYRALYDECIKRGYNVTNYLEAWQDVPPELYNDYTPTPEGIALIRERIALRLSTKKLGDI